MDADAGRRGTSSPPGWGWHLFLVAMLCLAALILGLSGSGGRLIDTGMHSLVPSSRQLGDAERRAEAQGDRQLNQQMVMLVGAADAETAMAAAEKLAARWRDSGVFDSVRLAVRPDMLQLQQWAARMQLAMMPGRVAAQLRDDPAAYFMQRAQDLVSPFGGHSLLPPEQDWLGLGRFLPGKLGSDGAVQWDAETGTLQTRADGRVWIWIQARLPGEGSIAAAPAGLLPLLDQTRTGAASLGVDVLTAGGAIFAAQGQASGERESRWMSMAGVGLTLFLLLATVRSLRVLGILLPLGGGFLLGLAGCVLVFGQVHVLTLVIGTSLVGVLVDLPMHWLAPALLQQGWRPWPVMRRVLPPYGISLLITVSGYLALGFAPLPVLQQTAVFSALALLGATLVSVLWLPPLFARWRPVPRPALVNTVSALHLSMLWLRRQRWVWLPGLVLALSGLWQSDWRDDIRQWVSVSPASLKEMQAVGHLGGSMASARYVLVQAPDDDVLLRRDSDLLARLEVLRSQGGVKGWQALSQWVLSQAQQREVQDVLRRLATQPSLWAPLQQLGVPSGTVRQSLLEVAGLPVVNLPDSLRGDMATAWQALYLGAGADGQVAALVRLDGLEDVAELQRILEGVPWAKLIDRPARLNALFHETRLSAIWLKLASWLLALVLLVALFGWRRGLMVLAVPFAAVLLTVAVLGWLGVAVSLFAVFGLLLVSAIGIDYAVYAQGATKEEGPERLAGIVLAALTSMISFALLGLSQTPAVAGFGLCVTLGIFFNLLLSAWLTGTDPAQGRASS